jgi:hypothetical protein
MSYYRLLILGGTQMLGRDFTQTLIDTGYTDLAIANRGMTNPTLFHQIHQIIY